MRTVLVYFLQLLALTLARNIHGNGRRHRERISLTHAHPHSSWNGHGSPNMDPHGQGSVTHVIHTSEPLDPNYRTRPLPKKVLDNGQIGDISYSHGAMIIHSNEPIGPGVVSHHMPSGHHVDPMHRGLSAMHASGRLHNGQLSPVGVVIHHISPQHLLETMSNTRKNSPFASGHNHKMPQEKSIVHDHTRDPSVVGDNSNINPFADSSGTHHIEGGPTPLHRHDHDRVVNPDNHSNGTRPGFYMPAAKTFVERPDGTDPHFNEHLSDSNHGPGGLNIPGDAANPLAGRHGSHGDTLWLGNPGDHHGDVGFPGRSLPGDIGSSRPGSRATPLSQGHPGNHPEDIGFPGRPLSKNTGSWRPGLQTMPLVNPVMPDRSSSLIVMNRQPNQWYWTGGNRSGKLNNFRPHWSRQ